MFSNVLPAPGTLINAAGILDSSGMPAPGFSGLQLKSHYNVELLEARSGRGQTVTDNKHYWSFTISYHPMTVTMFTGLESFLYGHNTRKNPFYVTLPNYSKPGSTAFATYASNNTLDIVGTFFAGESKVVIDVPNNQQLLPGCYINFVDSTNALHKSVYKVARVETPSVFVGSAPASGTNRITVFPPLQRDILGATIVTFIDPKFRVIQTNGVDPEYDENNLVTVNLEVRELVP